MRIIRYIISCFFEKPSPYQLRRNKKNPDLYMIFFQGKRIYEGNYKRCQEFINGRKLEVSPTLYGD